jgi:transcriptional regulator with XRE-family HTH domain
VAKKKTRSKAAAARTPRDTLGAFLRTQRRIAGLSLRQLAEITSVSNAYLSQIERNLHKPSVDVLRAVAQGLNVSAETLLDQVGLFEDPPRPAHREEGGSRDTEAAILGDPKLSDSQREALLAVYRSYLAENQE